MIPSGIRKFRNCVGQIMKRPNIATEIMKKVHIKEGLDMHDVPSEFDEWFGSRAISVRKMQSLNQISHSGELASVTTNVMKVKDRRKLYSQKLSHISSSSIVPQEKILENIEDSIHLDKDDSKLYSDFADLEFDDIRVEQRQKILDELRIINQTREELENNPGKREMMFNNQKQSKTNLYGVATGIGLGVSRWIDNLKQIETKDQETADEALKIDMTIKKKELHDDQQTFEKLSLMIVLILLSLILYTLVTFLLFGTYLSDNDKAIGMVYLFTRDFFQCFCCMYFFYL